MHGWDASSSEDGTAKAKDAVHKLEWDGQRWIAIHHATTRQNAFKVSKLKKEWNISATAPVGRLYYYWRVQHELHRRYGPTVLGHGLVGHNICED
eukprot:4643172-Amphidinium_carterae.1